MAHWKKRGIFMVENQVFGRAEGGIKMMVEAGECEKNMEKF